MFQIQPIVRSAMQEGDMGDVGDVGDMARKEVKSTT
jgi:hypothetical protein